MTKPKTILCPIDFSDSSKVGLEHAEEMARRFEARLLVAHVIEPVLYPVAYGLPASSPMVNIEEQAKKGALEALQPIVDDLVSRGVNAQPLVVTGTASLRICALIEEYEVDLVVMATHGLTGLQHVLLGSTAERVVRKSPVPVLSVKAPKE